MNNPSKESSPIKSPHINYNSELTLESPSPTIVLQSKPLMSPVDTLKEGINSVAEEEIKQDLINMVEFGVNRGVPQEDN